MNNSIPERFILQCALFKNLEREVFMTHGYVDSHIIDQALRLRLKDETSVILSDLYLQILQYIEMHKTTPVSYTHLLREAIRKYITEIVNIINIKTLNKMSLISKSWPQFEAFYLFISHRCFVCIFQASQY